MLSPCVALEPAVWCEHVDTGRLEWKLPRKHQFPMIDATFTERQIHIKIKKKCNANHAESTNRVTLSLTFTFLCKLAPNMRYRKYPP